MDRYPLGEGSLIYCKKKKKRLKYSGERVKTEVEFNYERNLQLAFLLRKQVQLQKLEIHQCN